MPKQKNGNDSKDNFAPFMAILGLLGLLVFMGVITWSPVEAITDYQIARKAASRTWKQLEMFINGGNQVTIIKVMDRIPEVPKYGTRILNNKALGDIRSNLKRLAENAITLDKLQRQHLQATKASQKKDLSEATRNRYQVYINKAEHEIDRRRMLHNKLFDATLNQLSSLRSKALSSYLLYLIPIYMVILTLFVWWINRHIFNKKEATEEQEAKSFQQATIMTPNPIEFGKAKRRHITAFHPPRKSGWGRTPFGQTLAKAWDPLGGMPPLAKEIASFLWSYKDCPASISGHCAYEGGLIEHTCHVVDEAIAYADKNDWKGKKKIMLILAAMAHDMGKALTYYKDGDVWRDNKELHDKASGWILESLPSFSTLSYEDAMSLFLAVKNRHDRDSIPTNFPAFSTMLFKALSSIDDKASSTEVKHSQQYIDESVEHVIELWSDIIDTLNINGYQRGSPDGYFDSSERIAFVKESRLTEAIINGLPNELSSRISKRAPRNQAHPLWLAVQPHLVIAGLINTSIESKSDSPYRKGKAACNSIGLTTVKTEHDIYRDAVPINVEIIEEGTLERWNIINPKEIMMQPIGDDTATEEED